MRLRARGDMRRVLAKTYGRAARVRCTVAPALVRLLPDLMRSSAIRLADNHVFRFNLPLRPFQGYQPTGRLEETAKRTQSSPGTIASVADAVLVNASTTKDGICFKEKQARYLARQTFFYSARQTFLHCCLAASAAAKRVDATPEVAHIECSRPQRQNRYDKYGNDRKRRLVTFHDSAPRVENTTRFGVTVCQ